MSIEINRINIEFSYIEDFEKFLIFFINLIEINNCQYIITELEKKPYANKIDGGKILPLLNFKYSYKKDNSDDNSILCETQEVLKNKIIEIVRENIQEFIRVCGEGYHQGFLPSDGSVEVGFKICDSKDTHPFDGIYTVSLMHLYFGK